jgi:hypothetical protein
MLMQDSSAVSLRKTETGVPVLVNPVLIPDTMGDATLGLSMTVGPDAVELLRKKKYSLSQGVPVLVNPVLIPDTMGNATLGLNMTVGADAVQVLR